MPTTLNVTVDVAFEDLPLLKHKLVEIDGVLTVLDQAPASGSEDPTFKSLLAAAEVAADHYLSEAEYFEREGEQESADSFASLEQGVRDLISKSSSFKPASGDPLLTKLEQLLDEDPTGVVRDHPLGSR